MRKRRVQTLDIQKAGQLAMKLDDARVNFEDLLNQKPLQSNYLVEKSYGIISGCRSSFAGEISFRPSHLTLKEHIEVRNLTYSCFVELSEDQFRLWTSKQNSLNQYMNDNASA